MKKVLPDKLEICISHSFSSQDESLDDSEDKNRENPPSFPESAIQFYGSVDDNDDSSTRSQLNTNDWLNTLKISISSDPMFFKVPCGVHVFAILTAIVSACGAGVVSTIHSYVAIQYFRMLMKRENVALSPENLHYFFILAPLLAGDGIFYVYNSIISLAKGYQKKRGLGQDRQRESTMRTLLYLNRLILNHIIEYPIASFLALMGVIGSSIVIYQNLDELADTYPNNSIVQKLFHGIAVFMLFFWIMRYLTTEGAHLAETSRRPLFFEHRMRYMDALSFEKKFAIIFTINAVGFFAAFGASCLDFIESYIVVWHLLQHQGERLASEWAKVVGGLFALLRFSIAWAVEIERWRCYLTRPYRENKRIKFPKFNRILSSPQLLFPFLVATLSTLGRGLVIFVAILQINKIIMGDTVWLLSNEEIKLDEAVSPAVLLFSFFITLNYIPVFFVALGRQASKGLRNSLGNNLIRFESEVHDDSQIEDINYYNDWRKSYSDEERKGYQMEHFGIDVLQFFVTVSSKLLIEFVLHPVMSFESEVFIVHIIALVLGMLCAHYIGGNNKPVDLSALSRIAEKMRKFLQLSALAVPLLVGAFIEISWYRHALHRQDVSNSESASSAHVLGTLTAGLLAPMVKRAVDSIYAYGFPVARLNSRLRPKELDSFDSDASSIASSRPSVAKSRSNLWDCCFRNQSNQLRKTTQLSNLECESNDAYVYM